MSAPDTAVHTATSDSALIITINRPAARNAVDGAVAAGIAAATEELEHDTDLRVGVLTGAQGTFSAGMDLKAAARGESPTSPHGGFGGLTEAALTKPLIAAVEGHAIGGGFELALACDLVVATTRARFGLPEVKRGLIAGGGGALRLPRRIPHHLAMELLLTGRSIDGTRAEQLGLVNRLVEDGSAVGTALQLAEEVTTGAPLALAAIKDVVRASTARTEQELFAEQRRTIRALRESDDFREGVAAFTDKRAPQWSGR